jgi:membrane protease YdiL (CAAX protease family)
MEEKVTDEERGKSGGVAPAVASIAIYLVLFFVLAGVAGMINFVVLAADRTGGGGDPSQLFDVFVMSFSMLAVAVLPAVVMLKCVDHRPLSDLGFSLKGRVEEMLCGALVAALIYAAGFGVCVAMGAVEVTGFDFRAVDLLVGLLIMFVGASTEEVTVRGYILGRLMRTSSPKLLSLAISALIFALFHGANPHWGWLPRLNLVLAGLMMGASFLYTRNLWFPIFLHTFWNWIQGPVLGFEVSGMDVFKSVITQHRPESNLINGGSFGFEGSIVCTLLLIATTVLILFYYEGKRKSCSLFHPDHA